MTVDFAFVCDYAEVGGKINAMGIGFDTIFAGVKEMVGMGKADDPKKESLQLLLPIHQLQVLSVLMSFLQSDKPF